MEYYIKEREWEAIFLKLSKIKGIHTKNKLSVKLFIEAVWYVVRSSCQWRLLPLYYGHWRAIHMRFRDWANKGVLEKLFQSMHDEKDEETVMLDGTIVRTHACSAGYKKDSQDREALGRSKGGFSTKIHTLVDALGNPLKFIITAGQRNDITQADSLIKDISNTVVIADKAYDADSFLQTIEKQGSIAIIPPRKNRKAHREYDKHLYKERHLIECLFGKIKHYRRLFSRFDKTATAFMGFLNFVGVLIWIR